MLKKIVAFLFLFSLVFKGYPTLAQSVDELSDVEIQQFIRQAQESGMTEDQLMAAAASKGYTASDILKFKERMTKLGAEKKTERVKAPNNLREVDSTDIETAKRENKRQILDQKEEEKRLKIFGLNIFNNTTLNFEPNLSIATPKNYVLGTNDELSIDITGYAYAHYTAKVSPEGTIKVENLSPIFVSGQTLEQAKAKIIQKLKTLFGGLGSAGLQADVNLSKIRSIKVNVIGEAVFPGSYTIPSLATAFNLLYAAGGPTEIGSLRNIEVFRGGKLLRKLDLYDFLLKGDLRDDVTLHDQDILLIPYVDARVVLNGAVRNPKIFEIKRGETLKTVLGYAGGFNEMAYSKTIRVDRITDTEKRILSVPQIDFGSFLPQRGDIIIVDSVLAQFENKVQIVGGVYRPGSYQLSTGFGLKKLLVQAEGLRADAMKDRVLVFRERPNLDPELISVDVQQIFSQNGEDFVLHKNDSVVVKTYSDLREKRTIQIDGEINRPGVIPFVENLSVADAIALSGGFKDGAASSKIEVARRVKESTHGLGKDQTIEIIQLEVDKNLKIDRKDFLVHPFDRIYVRRLARYEEQKIVSITGEINFPGPYSLQDKTERISDLIKKAGGVKDQGDLSSAKFTRSRKQIGVDLKNILAEPENVNNLLLTSGDILDIPRRKETVTISGNVYNPITVPFQTGFKLQDYLSLAGGTNDSAFVRKTYVKYGNGKLARTKSFLGMKNFPEIESGAEIFVPLQKKQRWSAAERIAVSSAMVSIATIMVTIIRLF
jgi:polysaccharide biosynthesis/export protein